MQIQYYVFLAVAVVLAGCSEKPNAYWSEVDPKEKLGTSEIENTIVEKTLYNPGRNYDGELPARYGPLEYSATFNQDGTMDGRMWFRGGYVDSTGQWDIKKNKLCQSWADLRFPDNERTCYDVFKNGEYVKFEHSDVGRNALIFQVRGDDANAR